MALRKVKYADGGLLSTPPNIQKLGNIQFDSNTAIQNKNGSLQVKDLTSGKNFAVVRKQDGSYDFLKEENPVEDNSSKTVQEFYKSQIASDDYINRFSDKNVPNKEDIIKKAADGISKVYATSTDSPLKYGSFSTPYTENPEKNIVIVDKTQAKKFNTSENDILAHEYSHIKDRFLRNTFYDNQPTSLKDSYKDAKSTDINVKNVKDSHDASTEEMQSDLDAMRYHLYHNNIISHPYKHIEAGSLEEQKILNAINNNPNINSQHTVKRVKELVKPDKIINFLNSYSATDAPVNNNEQDVKYAALGGNLDNDNTNNNSMANRMDMRKMMFRKIYADGGSLVGLGSSILDNVGQNADGTTNSGTSFLSGALKYGSMGAALGPIGAIGGGLVGGLVDLFSSQNKNNAIDRQRSDNEMKYKTAEQNRTNSQIRLANTNVGNTGTYYGMGGSMRFGQGGNVEAMSGGEMQPIAPNVQEAVGLKHSQGGIDVQTPNGKQAQVEGGEVIKDNDEVFSDQLKTENGMTYAQVAKEVADSSEYKVLKGKIDVAKRVMNNPNSNEFAKNAAKREIEKNPDPLDALFQQQEQAKQQQTVQTAGNVNNTPQQNPQQMQDPQQQQMSQQQQPTMAAGGTISKPDLDDVETESDAHRMARTYGDFDMPDNTMQTPNASPFNIKDALQGVGQKLGKYDYNKIVPYLDNFVNAKTTANTRQLPAPTYINPAQYNTQYDVSAPLNVIKTQSAAAIQGINNSSSNSNTSRINAANIFTKGIDESNNLYGSKIYAENEMKNRQVGENQRVMEHNAQMLDQHKNNNNERSIGIQNQVNKNAANAVGDFEKQNLEHLTKVKDQQALFLETQKYKDSGVLERADVARTMDLIQQGHTVSQAKTMIQQEKEAKQKEQDRTDEEEARINSTRSKNRRFDRLQVPTSGLLNSMNSSMPNFNR